jgi:hypothetical protein
LSGHLASDSRAANKEFLLNIAFAPSASSDSDISPKKAMVDGASDLGSGASSVPVQSGSMPSEASSGNGTSGVQASNGTSFIKLSMSEVSNDITQFEQAHPGFEVANLGNKVIICDPNITSSANYSAAVKEVCSFSDGSSVLLIGLPAPHVHLDVIL